jgi:glycosyltransferase involved in cell wall biosynthesis
LNVSLIITTYNWPEALAVVLQSVLQQTYASFQVLVADDGSSQETADTVAAVLESAPFPWRHVRHGDCGIRQARVKNLGVRYATGEYLIFIDHDVALHPEFIKDHVECAAADCFLQGKRVFLSPEMTARQIQASCFTPPSPFSPGLENRKNGFRAPALAGLVNRKKPFQVTLRGCNLSMPRAAFLDVDGYDETFDGLWGREDSDICYRLFNSGRFLKNLWLAGLQYHLHHPSIKRTGRDRLDEELDRVLNERRTRSLQGYSTLSDEGEVVAGRE